MIEDFEGEGSGTHILVPANDKPKDKDKDKNKLGPIEQCAFWMEKAYTWAIGPIDQLYMYDVASGAWRAVETKWLAPVLRQWLKENFPTAIYTKEMYQRVTTHCSSSAQVMPEIPNPRFMNLLNGILDLQTLTLQPHTPHPPYRTPNQIPVAYRPGHSSKRWEEFLKAMFAEDWEWALGMLGWLVRPIVEPQYVFCLIAHGGNGKTALIRAMRTFLGAANVSNKNLPSLENNNFATAVLNGKLVNFCDDEDFTDRSARSMFRKITGGSTISAELKFGGIYDFQPYCRLFMAANDVLQVGEAEGAMSRRLKYLVANKDWEMEPSENRKPIDQIIAELSEPYELSGLLNMVIGQMDKPIVLTQKMMEFQQEVLENNSPLWQWATGMLVRDETGTVDKSELYKSFCAAYPGAIRTPMIFHKSLRKVLWQKKWDGVDFDAKKRIGSKTVNVVRGVRLGGDGNSKDLDSHPAIIFPSVTQ